MYKHKTSLIKSYLTMINCFWSLCSKPLYLETTITRSNFNFPWQFELSGFNCNDISKFSSFPKTIGDWNCLPEAIVSSTSYPGPGGFSLFLTAWESCESRLVLAASRLSRSSLMQWKNNKNLWDQGIVNHNPEDPEHSMPFNSIRSTCWEKNLNDLFQGNIPRIISKF